MVDACQASIYLFKVSNQNTRKKVWNIFEVNNKTSDFIYVVMVFLLLTLDIFHTFSQCF